jgi:hypothetical protein
MNTDDLFARQAVLDHIRDDLAQGYARQKALRLKRAAAAYRGIENHRQLHWRVR